MSVTGDAGSSPTKCGAPIADILTGMYAAVGILVALQERERSGLGQHIDTCLLDTQIAALAHLTSSYLATGRSAGRHGNAHPTIAPYQSFDTADEPIIVGVGNDQQYQRLVCLMNNPALADPRFRPMRAAEHRDELLRMLEREFRPWSAESWLSLVESNEISCDRLTQSAQRLKTAM